jgi:hypothetical protein
MFNSLNYQNRLRHPEYIEMLHKAGFRLVREEPYVDEASLRDLTQIRLAERFRKFSREDLATIESLLLAVKGNPAMDCPLKIPPCSPPLAE